ncbi:hypothetical protein ABZX51_004606 [Aspergillus tubingensis]
MLAKLGGSCMFSNGSSFLYAISFYFFFYHFFCHPGAARFFFYDFFSAFVLLNRMPFPSFPFSTRLDSTSCSEQNKGGNGNKGQNGKRKGSISMDWAVMHLAPRMRMRM